MKAESERSFNQRKKNSGNFNQKYNFEQKKKNSHFDADDARMPAAEISVPDEF